MKCIKCRKNIGPKFQVPGYEWCLECCSIVGREHMTAMLKHRAKKERTCHFGIAGISGSRFHKCSDLQCPGSWRDNEQN